MQLQRSKNEMRNVKNQKEQKKRRKNFIHILNSIIEFIAHFERRVRSFVNFFSIHHSDFVIRERESDRIVHEGAVPPEPGILGAVIVSLASSSIVFGWPCAL